MSYVAPFRTRVHVAPPSVDAKRPLGETPGGNAQQPFDEIPATPFRVLKRMWFLLLGAIARPGIVFCMLNGSEPATADQWSPPSVLRYRPRPTSLSPLP